MPSKPKDESLPVWSNMETAKLEFRAVEDEQEKAQRLHKERWTFYVKDILPWGASIVVLLTACVFCLWISVRDGYSPAEKDWARSILTAVISGAAGVFFGKQLGK